jgi:UDP-glucuronate 4-epimerase
MNILITGVAGFIGYSLSKNLCSKNIKIVGIDNLNNYYDVKIKKKRLKILKKYSNFTFHRADIINIRSLKFLFTKYKFNYVVHLAAQAGVRYSLKKPRKYFDSNLEGFFNILDLSAKFNVKHFLYASTSSVYGNSKKFPLTENDNTDHPESFYAATKKCNEVMAYSYSKTNNLPTTGMRFFTVYGPYGRPDMALFKFVSNILKNKKIELYNYGNHSRDFTYIDDVVNAIVKLIPSVPKNNYQIINIARGFNHRLYKFLKIIEKNLFTKAKIKYINFQKGDVISTLASIKKLKKKIKYKPSVNLKTGIKYFIDWYFDYYKIKYPRK